MPETYVQPYVKGVLVGGVEDAAMISFQVRYYLLSSHAA